MEKTTTAITRQTESLVGPVLVRCEDDLDEKTVLAKVGMPSVHLLLSVNDILNKVVEICFDGNRSELLDLLGTQVGVLPHSYQGRERAYAGTFFGNKEFKCFPLTQNLKNLYLCTFVAKFSWHHLRSFSANFFCPKYWTPPLFSAFRRYSMICYGYHGMLSMTFSGIEIYTTL